jgi:hypothetical protein
MRTLSTSPAALVALLLTSCTTDRPPAAPITLAPHVDCDHPPPAPAHANEGFQGESSSGSVVALLFADPSDLSAGKELKIVWRVTGTGMARFSATGPGSRSIAPVWGPEGHGGSNFNYPGEEWGTGFLFPTPGCWTVHVQRDDLTGSLSLPIS